MMNFAKKLALGVFTVCLTISSVSWGHGNLDIDYENGRVRIAPGPNGLVFYSSEINDFLFGFATDGIADLPLSQGGGDLTPGDGISFQILDSLYFHDGTSFATNADAIIRVLPGGWLATTSSGASPVTPWATVQADGKLHEHLNFIERGLTTPVGAYGLLMQLDSTNPGIGPSDPFFIILNEGLEESEVLAILPEFEQILTVPELNPMVLMFACAGMASGVSVVRRLRTHRSKGAC